MAHANARLTPAGRLTLVQRISAQPRRPIAHIAHEMGISRTTASRWSRYQQLGQAGLVDRPSIRPTAPGGPPLGSSSASWGCADDSGSARPASLLGLGSLPPRSTESWSVMAATGWPTWTAQLAGRSAAMSTSIPVTWSTWTPRSSAASL
jgi:hypothetical protein